MSTLKNKDLVSIKDLNKKEILHVLEVAKKFKKKRVPKLLQGKILGSLFFEPSTRTRLSFESAIRRLGGQVIGFDDPSASSTQKGESLEDTIRMVDNYADIIVIRHPEKGSAKEAAETAKKPVINAGDGANQHPTQTLLDLYTILETQKKLDNLNIAMMGDLKNGRTVHSLAQALTHFKAKLFFISPDSLKMPESIKKELRACKIKFSEHKKLSEIIKEIDILYVTRIQKERFSRTSDYDKVKNLYILGKKELKGAKKNLKVLHPLPRVNEIKKEVDSTHYAHYFKQAENGLYVRQALLALILKG